MIHHFRELSMKSQVIITIILILSPGTVRLVKCKSNTSRLRHGRRDDIGELFIDGWDIFNHQSLVKYEERHWSADSAGPRWNMA